MHGVLVRLWQPWLHRAWDQRRIWEHAHVWEDVHLPQDRQQLPVSWGRRLLFPIDEAKERRTLVGRGHAPQGDHHLPAGGGGHFFNEGHDVMYKVCHTGGKGDIPRDVLGGKPVSQDSAGVGDTRLCRARLELGEHAGRGIHVDYLAAAQSQRQTDPSGTATHVEEHVIWLHVGRNDLQVGIKVAVRISAKALRHWAAKAVLQRLVAVDAATLGIHGINESGIGLGSSHSWSLPTNLLRVSTYGASLTLLRGTLRTRSVCAWQAREHPAKLAGCLPADNGGITRERAAPRFTVDAHT